MKNNYTLIDFENVQPKNLEILLGHAFTLIVFVGANQKSVPIEFASKLQRLGEHAKYQTISGTGSNALDFHIAFYIGELAAKDPNGYFHIISRDKGFDPLIRHLRDRKIFALRSSDLSEVPFVKISNATSLTEKIDAIVGNLKTRGNSKPRKPKTLANTVNTLFMNRLSETELGEVIAELKRLGHISVNDQAISYGSAILGR